MKKIIVAFLLTIVVLTNVSCINQNIAVHTTKQEQQNVIEEIVYQTKTGRKYHLSSCQYLNYSKIPIDKPSAIELGLTPCKVCNP